MNQPTNRGADLPNYPLQTTTTPLASQSSREDDEDDEDEDDDEDDEDEGAKKSFKLAKNLVC